MPSDTAEINVWRRGNSPHHGAVYDWAASSHFIKRDDPLTADVSTGETRTIQDSDQPTRREGSLLPPAPTFPFLFPGGWLRLCGCSNEGRQGCVVFMILVA